MREFDTATENSLDNKEVNIGLKEMHLSDFMKEVSEKSDEKKKE